jgi:hypothetical protein
VRLANRGSERAGKADNTAAITRGNSGGRFMNSFLDMEEGVPWRGEALKIYAQALFDAIPWIESPSPFFYIT